jgi:nucleotide-binding universal stress UspA family protein
VFKKILVPLDGSELAERALEPAFTLAQQDTGKVVLLSVPILKQMVVRERGGYGVLLPHQSLEFSWNTLSNYLQSVQQAWTHPNLTTQTRVVDGDEASVIVDTAARENVDLIVMSTHGRSGLSRWVMGSVTEKVLRSATCPVLVIRSQRPLSRILITLDGSEFAERAVAPGLEVARRLGSQVTLLRMEQPVSVAPEEIKQLEQVEYGLGTRLTEDLREEAKLYLGKIAQHYQRETGVMIKTVATIGPAATGILEYSEGHNIDLIVMATHGRTGLRRWVYGSVTEKVLRGAQCAMLIVRPAADELKDTISGERA